MENISKKQGLYKLVGFSNMFEIVPDFVYPIFQSYEDKKYYFQDGGDEEIRVKRFVEVKKSFIEKITFFKDGITTNDILISEISINSKPIFAFQDSESHVQVGNYEEMKEFFKSFEVESTAIQNEINVFIRD